MSPGEGDAQQQHSPDDADQGEYSRHKKDDDCSHGDAPVGAVGTVLAVLAAPARYPLVFNSLALAMQHCPGLCQARAGDEWWEAHALELATLALASAFTLVSWPGLVWMEGRCMRSLTPILLMLCSAAGLALGWYNVWQDDYFLESCFLSDWKQACLNPRYRWYDVIYDYAFREKCMMARMQDPTSFTIKERQCYVIFHDRGPQCLKFFCQCLLAAAVIGFFAINDSPLVAQSPPDEAHLLAEAHVQENMREGERYLADYRAAALCDYQD